MDCGAFAERLPGLFPAGDVYAETPVDRRFAGVVERVDGMSTEHSLTLLNLAASLLGPDETYLEVGSYRGRSLVGAALGQSHDRFLAIENFREFGLDPARSEQLLRDALRDWDVADRVTFRRGDAFRLIPRRVGPRPVGVYFYDGAHSRLAQYLALGLVEPLLADEALVVIDDASWPQVARATGAYLARHPGYRLLFDLRAERAEDPRWCNGVAVYQWRRPAGHRAGPGLDLAWRRLAHLYLHEPAMTLAWQVLPRYPRLSAALKKLYLHGGSEVPAAGPPA
ncbi:MAG TPA: class I SAM-dependent methyltransferase [Mycobacteriales bacterium]|nr:class I SAM-dependent methyltransferase [Mycobacteriales bacterium]